MMKIFFKYKKFFCILIFVQFFTKCSIYVHSSRGAYIFLENTEFNKGNKQCITLKLARTSGKLKYISKAPVPDSMIYSRYSRNSPKRYKYFVFSGRHGDGWQDLKHTKLIVEDTSLLSIDNIKFNEKSYGYCDLCITIKDSGLAKVRIKADDINDYIAFFYLTHDSLLFVEGGMKSTYTKKCFSKDTISKVLFQGENY